MKIVINGDVNKYKSFLIQHTRCNFAQSPEWAKLKSEWENAIITVEDDNGNIKGGMSVLIRKIPFLGVSMMYAPRGPVCDLHDEEVLKALMEGANRLAKKHRAYLLKLDTDTEITDTRYIQIMKDLGFRIQDTSRNFEGIQPRFVFRLDIAGKTEEEVMMGFHQKWRYNIRLAAKKGVVVKLGQKEDIRRIYGIMLETGIRDGFVVRSPEYFEKMFDCLAPEHMRLYMACYEEEVIAWTIAILYGNKCWYLYGASSNKHRNKMPNYLLQWEMIKWAIESGCEIYDFRGVSGDLNENNPLYGLYRFKKGFNGKLTEFVGEMDYIYRPVAYFMVEKGIKLFRELRAELFKLKHRKKKKEVAYEETGNREGETEK